MQPNSILKPFGMALLFCLLLISLTAGAQNALRLIKASSQYVTVPHSSSINLAGTYTLEAVVNYSGANLAIVDKGDYDFLFELNPNANGNKLGMFTKALNGWVYSTLPVPQNVTTHVAAVLSGGIVTFYINGVAAGGGPLPFSQDANAMNIGRQAPATCQCNHFNGYMDELRIWNIARTGAELQANMSGEIPANSTGLVAYYKFNESSGTITADATSNANNGTLVNGATFVSNACTIYPEGRAYVKANASGTNTGTSWANAFNSLESALAAARSCQLAEIWVAAGTYKPSALPVGNTTGVSTDYTFQLPDGVKLFGGFAGTETELVQRNPTTSLTLLSGDLNGNDGANFTNIADNCAHVVLSLNNAGATIDGFTIRGGGNAVQVSGMGGQGAGLWASGSITLNRVVFDRNIAFLGGGFFNQGSATLTNCVFSNNAARRLNVVSSGGGMANEGTATLTNVIFANNTAVGVGGAYITGGSSNITSVLNNVVFSGNSVLSVAGIAGWGGAAVNNAGTATYNNCTFFSNSAVSRGGAVYNTNAVAAQFRNCIFWSNSAPGASNIDNSANSGVNPTLTNSLFDTDPLFANSASPAGPDNIFMNADDGLRIASNSPAVNNGTSTGAPATDIINNVRSGNTDVGAYEHNPTARVFQDGSLIRFFSCAGSSSSVQIFTVSGIYLNGDVVITAPAGFEVSANGSGFSSSVSFGNASFSLSTRSVYIRMAASATGTPAGNVTVTSIGANTISIPVNGIMNTIPAKPTISPAGTVNACGSSVTLTSNAASGNQWYLNGNPIAGANNTTYSATASGNYTVRAAGYCISAVSDAVAVTLLPFSGNIAFVDAGVAASGTGDSWPAAFKTLQEALTAANTCSNITQIWVAAGTYKPGTARTAFFAMKNNLAIYGGFNGTETLLGERNWATNETILSGDLNGDDWANFANNGENSHHVIVNNGLNSTAILDGFTVRGGNDDSGVNGSGGGGIFNSNSSITLSNCFFTSNAANAGGGAVFNNASSAVFTNCHFSANRANQGAAVYNFAGLASVFTDCSFTGNVSNGFGSLTNLIAAGVTVNNCSFTGNSANTGAAMYNQGNGTYNVTNCNFTSNTAINGGAINNSAGNTNGTINISSSSFSGNTASSNGGAIYNMCRMYAINCTFIGNTASTSGGAINSVERVDVTNCSFSGNSAPADGTMRLISNNTILNTIVWGNSSGITFISSSNNTFSNAIIQGGCPANATCSNVQNVDPLFVSQPPVGLGTAGNLRLQNGSPAINTGTNTGAPSTDIEGNTRPLTIANPADMGAYEFDPCQNFSTAIAYVDDDIASSGNGSTWASAFKTLQEALTAANTCTSITQIWVAKGIYYPDQGGSFANNDRNASFSMVKNVAIYGGFAGNEPANYNLASRNFVTNETILSGDLDQNDGANFANNSQNAYHVVYNYDNQLYNNSILNGFTITAGNANGAFPTNSGGGMYTYHVSPVIANCIFKGNTATNGGGGMYSQDEIDAFSGVFPSDSIKVQGCTFITNTAATGGGMYTFQTAAGISRTVFSQNAAYASAGGGLFVSDARPILSNVVFAQNSAITSGGGISTFGSNAVILNGTFSNNTVQNAPASNRGGGGIFFSNDIVVTLRMLNCVFWGNTEAGVANSFRGANNGIYATNCNIQNIGAYPVTAVNCIDQNPLFVNAANSVGADNVWMTADDGLALICNSPAVNAGTGSANIQGVTYNAPAVDITGNARVEQTDMGAYEFKPVAEAFSIAAGNQSVTNTLAANQEIIFRNDCSSLMAKLVSNGTSPVSGSITARLWLESTQPTYNGRPFLRRHYEITPAINPSGATGTITLYFTQQEFNDFNAFPFNGPDLPANKDDVANISNFAIYKYSGTSADGTGLPGSYPQPGILIAVPNVSLVWNDTKQWWEATFAVTGFSGFFGGNNNLTILPVSDLLNFNVVRQGAGAAINWQVLASSKVAQYVVEKSYDNSQFMPLQTVPGKTGTTYYGITDPALKAGIQYYRMKLVEKDGSISYSGIRSLQAGGLQQVMVHPNPVKTGTTLTVDALQAGTIDTRLTNSLGQTLAQHGYAITAGKNVVPLSLSRYAAGVYYLHYTFAGTSGVLRVVKEW